MTTAQALRLTQDATARLDELRPLLRSFADLLDTMQTDPPLCCEQGVELLRVLSEEIARRAVRLDAELHHGCTPTFGYLPEVPHDSEGGAL